MPCLEFVVPLIAATAYLISALRLACYQRGRRLSTRHLAARKLARRRVMPERSGDFAVLHPGQSVASHRSRAAVPADHSFTR